MLYIARTIHPPTPIPTTRLVSHNCPTPTNTDWPSQRAHVIYVRMEELIVYLAVLFNTTLWRQAVQWLERREWTVLFWLAQFAEPVSLFRKAFLFFSDASISIVLLINVGFKPNIERIAFRHRFSYL